MFYFVQRLFIDLICINHSLELDGFHAIVLLIEYFAVNFLVLEAAINFIFSSKCLPILPTYFLV